MPEFKKFHYNGYLKNIMDIFDSFYQPENRKIPKVIFELILEFLGVVKNDKRPLRLYNFDRKERVEALEEFHRHLLKKDVKS